MSRDEVVEAEIRLARSVMIKTTYNDLVDSQRRCVKKEEKSTSASRSVLRNARLSSSGLAGLGAGIQGPTGLGLWPPLWSSRSVYLGREIGCHGVSSVTQNRKQNGLVRLHIFHNWD